MSASCSAIPKRGRKRKGNVTEEERIAIARNGSPVHGHWLVIDKQKTEYLRWGLPTVIADGKKDKKKRRRRHRSVAIVSNEHAGQIWFQCSVSCGVGVQYREVLCVARTNNEFVVLPASNCSGSRPANEQVCRAAACTPTWFTSDWSKVNRESSHASRVDL